MVPIRTLTSQRFPIAIPVKHLIDFQWSINLNVNIDIKIAWQINNRVCENYVHLFWTRRPKKHIKLVKPTRLSHMQSESIAAMRIRRKYSIPFFYLKFVLQLWNSVETEARSLSNMHTNFRRPLRNGLMSLDALGVPMLNCFYIKLVHFPCLFINMLNLTFRCSPHPHRQHIQNGWK